MKKIDCRGLACPMPVISTKKYFEGIEEGIAEVVVDNEIANTNITRFSENEGFKNRAYRFDQSGNQGEDIQSAYEDRCFPDFGEQQESGA